MRKISETVFLFFLICAGFFAACITPVFAAVRVVEDEVYFTIRAPGAKAVYLVGDFNNWNATVEKMERSGENFEISLFLLEGSYRYKFVVDDKWIVDPDNPGADPARGSPLVLVEKPAGLALRTQEVAERKTVRSITPTFRYIGRFEQNRPEGAGLAQTGDEQIVDLDVAVNRHKLRGRALLKSTDASWDLSNVSADVTVDRAYAGADVGNFRLDLFDNDGVVWESGDPFGLTGDLGVYGYNAGYERKGLSVEYSPSRSIHAGVLYADHTGERSVIHSIPGPGLFSAASGRDTTVYSFDESVGGSDVFAFELSVKTGGISGGVATRSNRGKHPGLLADLSFADSAATVYRTAENTHATALWIQAPVALGISAVFSYGQGYADIHKLSFESASLDSASDICLSEEAKALDQRIEFETSKRLYTGLERRTDRLFLSGGWDRTTFEFEGGVYADSRATIDRGQMNAAYETRKWQTALSAGYTRQDYGETPPELYIDSPARNMWLDWRDGFTVGNMTGIDADSFTDISVSAVWYTAPTAEETEDTGANESPPPRNPVTPRTSIQIELGATAAGFLEGLEQKRARLTSTYLFRDRYYASADGRVAVYDKAGWGAKETFLSGYVELGYRYRWIDINVGWGFDPVVFDGVINEYNDIGRTEILRQAVAGGVRRGDAANTGSRLKIFERLIQDDQTIKLECIVRF